MPELIVRGRPDPLRRKTCANCNAIYTYRDSEIGDASATVFTCECCGRPICVYRGEGDEVSSLSAHLMALPLLFERSDAKSNADEATLAAVRAAHPTRSILQSIRRLFTRKKK